MHVYSTVYWIILNIKARRECDRVKLTANRFIIHCLSSLLSTELLADERVVLQRERIRSVWFWRITKLAETRQRIEQSSVVCIISIISNVFIVKQAEIFPHSMIAVDQLINTNNYSIKNRFLKKKQPKMHAYLRL